MSVPGALHVTTPSDREIAMTRVFHAPRRLVFKALTKPELVRRWLGVFGDWSFAVCEIDLRVGGGYHYLWRRKDGAEVEMHGEYREIVPPERIVQTEIFDDPWYAGEAVGTAVLVEQDGKTTLTTTVLYESEEVRDAVLKSPMEKGVALGYDQLDTVLATLTVEESIADRYRRHADAFGQIVAAVQPEQWSNPSPCAAWNAREVVGHIIDMHAAMLRPVGRTLSPATTLQDDPLAAFIAARADVEAILADSALVGKEYDTPSGRMPIEQQIDQVVSEDMVLHGWDLARATGQGDTMDPRDVERLTASFAAIPPELMEKFRTPGAFGPGIEVFGPEVKVAEDASPQDRILGSIGRDPAWAPPVDSRAGR
jgi:uncharacterized protein (TIGR03086 family)